MKAFVLLAIALTVLGCESVEEQHKKAMLEFAASDNYHAEVCRDGDKLMAYRTLIAETPNAEKQWVPIIRIIGQMVLDEKSSYCDGELIKGQSKFIPPLLDGSGYYRFDGSEVRTLSKVNWNMTTKKASRRSIEGYPNETIKTVFDIPYVTKDQFDIRNYEVEFSMLNTVFVTDKWTCQKVDDVTYHTLVQ